MIVEGMRGASSTATSNHINIGSNSTTNQPQQRGRSAWRAAAASGVAAGRRALVGSPSADNFATDQSGRFQNHNCSCAPPLEMLRASSVEERQLRRCSTSPAGNLLDNDRACNACSSSALRTSSNPLASSTPPTPSTLLKVQPRKVEVWVPDESAQRCYACGADFTTYLRRHHCRACGNCFCYECCRRSVVLPRDLVRYPAPSHRALEFEESEHDVSANNNINNSSSSINSSECYRRLRASNSCIATLSSSLPSEQPPLVPNYIQQLNSKSGRQRPHVGQESERQPPPLERACERCFESLTRDMAVWPLVRLFDIWQLDVATLRRVSRVCRLWHAAAVRSLSAFREIQYRLPSETLSERERYQLQINAHLIKGHGLWMFHLLRSRTCVTANALAALDLTSLPTTVASATTKVDEKRNRECRKTVMCSRYCSDHVRPTEALHLLRQPHIVRNDLLYQHSVVWSVEHANDSLLLILMPALSYAVRFQPPNGSDALSSALVARCAAQRPLSLSLYWCLTLWSDLAIASQQYSDCERYARALQRLNRTVSPKESALLSQGERVVRALMKQRSLDEGRYPISNVDFLLPTHPAQVFAALDTSRGGTVMQPSASQPIARRFLVAHNDVAAGRNAREHGADEFLFGEEEVDNIQNAENQSNIDSLRVLFKREDVRRDLVVMSVIRYAAGVLAAELTDFSASDIVTYNVVPTGEGRGLIEMVEHATTLYDIRHRYQSTLFRFLVERNQSEPVAALRARFIRSAAAYSVITYLISAGDRHLENVMVTDSGLLFHIDYGYIFGEDPKPLAAPAIRIPPEMIDAIGGEGTESYVQFTEFCSRIYNCLRRHVGPISTLLALLVDLRIVSADKMREHLMSRFMPGECSIEATINLSSTISKSQHTYKQTLIDLSHRSARTTSAFLENPLGVLSSFWGGAAK
jgi:hypothetical protein